MSLSKIKYNTKCGVCSGDDWHDCDCGNDLFNTYQTPHNSQVETSFHTLQRVPTQHNVPVETSPHISQVETSSHTSHETSSQSEQVNNIVGQNDIWNTCGYDDSIFSAYQTQSQHSVPVETSTHISQAVQDETSSQSEQVNDIWNTYGDGDSIFSAYQTQPSQAIPSENNDGKYAFIFIHSCFICYFIFHSCILIHSFTCSMYNLQRTKLARVFM